LRLEEFVANNLPRVMTVGRASRYEFAGIASSCPPVTGSTAPVMKLAAREARKIYAGASSAG
jgi:hypothetical protein